MGRRAVSLGFLSLPPPDGDDGMAQIRICYLETNSHGLSQTPFPRRKQLFKTILFTSMFVGGRVSY